MQVVACLCLCLLEFLWPHTHSSPLEILGWVINGQKINHFISVDTMVAVVLWHRIVTAHLHDKFLNDIMQSIIEQFLLGHSRTMGYQHHWSWSRLVHDDVIRWKYSSALLALCAGNSPVTGEFPSQRPVTRSFDRCDLRLNKRLSKQSRRRWFDMPSRSLWRQCNVIKSTISTRVQINLHVHTSARAENKTLRYRVMHICVSEISHYWLRRWLGICLPPSY